MRITRLLLTGFKSFVDPVDLRIEPGLTGVVGPNGCGKSNLLEALRWVMGENRPTSMRGGGMDDLIFAGTEARPQRQFAEVALTAERPGAEPQLEVARRIDRGTGSTYRVNGDDARAKDVALIFADAATGAHSPALVSQGRISAIISAKPEQRREMLEEAAGISGLHARRRDAEQKLRAAERNLERLADLLSDMDARAGALRRQARAAERYRALAAEIETAEARVIYVKWRAAAQAAKGAREQAENAKTDVRNAAAQHAESVRAQAEVADSVATVAAELTAARGRLGDARMELAEREKKRALREQRTQSINDEAQRIARDRVHETEAIAAASEALEQLESELADITDAIARAQPEQARAKAAADAAQQTADTADRAAADALAAIAETRAERRIANASYEVAAERLATIDGSLKTLRSERDGLLDPAALDAAVEQAMREQKSAHEKAKLAAERANRLAIERDSLGAEAAEARAALAERQAENAGLLAERAALDRDLGNRDAGNRAIDTLKCEQGYEAALAAALGDDLSAGVGVGGDRFWSAAPTAPGDLSAVPEDRLLHHVDAPPALRRRLGEIIVAKTDDGRPLDPGQRLVTRDGALRRWDGFVARHGGASDAEQLRRANRLAEIGPLCEAARAKVDSAADHSERAAQRLASVEQSLEEARAHRARAEDAGHLAARDATEAEQARDTADRVARELKSRLTEQGEQRDLALVALNDAAAALDRLAPTETSDDRLSALEARRDTARRDVLESQAELSAIEQQLSAQGERRAVLTSQIHGWRERAGEAERRAGELDARAAENAEELARTQNTFEHHGTDEIRATVDALEVEIATLETQSADLDSDRRQREARVAAHAETLSDARERRAGAAARADNEDRRRIEMGRIASERFQCPPPLLPTRMAFEEAELESDEGESARLERAKASRERIGAVNLIAADELAELDAELADRRGDSDELVEAVRRLRGSIQSLNREGRARLTAAFHDVDRHFQRLFTTLFDGGSAHLVLVDSDDPLDAGLEIMAQPPGKKLASLTLLSGGEQALTAIALIFSLFLTNPAPICVLDEVDAPLDDANIERFCDLLDRMVAETDTRYLIVTHNAVTMSRMHRLYGVTMVEQGVSRLVSVNLAAAEEALVAE